MTEEEKKRHEDKLFRAGVYDFLFGEYGELHNAEPQIDKVYVISINNQTLYAGVNVELLASFGLYPKDLSRGLHKVFYVKLYVKDDFEKVCRERQFGISTLGPTYCLDFDMSCFEDNMPDTYEDYLNYIKLIEL